LLKTASITGLGYVLAPIVHNEVMPYGYEYSKGAARKQRTMPLMIERDGRVVRTQVPVVSGNAVRGLGRRLLIDHSFAELELNMQNLLGNKEEARRMTYFFRNGGLTPRDVAVEKVPVGTYESIQSRIPFLLALGGVYQGHHFEGHVKIGIQILLTVETYPLYKNILSAEHRKIVEEKPLPSLNDLYAEMRYTRRAGEDQGEGTELMIYGTEVIPAGTYLGSWASVVTPYESAVKTFRAMFWLLAEYGYVGGMSGRGHGKVLFSFRYTDENGEQELQPEDYQDYLHYLHSHAGEIKEAIRSIPGLLKWRTKGKEGGAVQALQSENKNG